MKENVTADETGETTAGEEVVAAEGESETSDNAETSNVSSQNSAIVAANNAEQGERQSENTIEGSDFTGSALAYFGINILWLLGTIFSLGIAYPFLTAWKLRWVANHTWYDGKKVVFDGTGPQLFGSYIKWLLLSLVTCGIYWIFVMPLNIKRWKTKHMHFEGEEGESHFDGSIWGLFGQRFVCNLVTFITLGLGWFWAHCHRERWYAKHTYIDGYRLRFEGKGMQFFGKCIVWVLLTIVTLGIYGIWLAVKAKKWTARKTHIEGQFVVKGVTSTTKKGSTQTADSKQQSGTSPPPKSNKNQS